MGKFEDMNKRRKRAHTKLVRSGSPVYAAFIDMERAAYADGELAAMYKELIAVGISVVIDCESCMQWHIGQAAEARGYPQAGARSRGGGHRDGGRPGHGLGALRVGGHGRGVWKLNGASHAVPRRSGRGHGQVLVLAVHAWYLSFAVGMIGSVLSVEGTSFILRWG